MTKRFFKTKECGCIVSSIVCGIKNTETRLMYLIGSHDHFSICNKCKQIKEKNDEDILYDMWINDCITDDFEYGGWKEETLAFKKTA
jgi:hypothetical protein